MRSFFDSTYPATGARGSLAPVPPDYVDARALAANTPVVHPIPAGAVYVTFSATDDFFARFGAAAVTAALPSSDVLDGSAPELNPGARRVPDGATHVALVAKASAVVTLSFYGV